MALMQTYSLTDILLYPQQEHFKCYNTKKALKTNYYNALIINRHI